jgi:hypothetical protein
MDVLVLVCALTVAAPDCQAEASVHAFYAPAPQLDFVGCLREGMMYAAQSGLVAAGTYSKIVCIPPEARRTRVTKGAEPRPDTRAARIPFRKNY